MRIKVIFTGGTIGSSVNEDAVISTDSATAGKLLLENYFNKSKSSVKKDVVFDVSEPYSCLSEDLTVDTWNTLIDALKEVPLQEYDGIIITHGTDTMAYTANLLSVLLCGVGVPVVLVGSNHVITDARANGNQNFSDAVDFIALNKCPGVYVIFSGQVYLGSRILQCRPFTDDYASVSGVDFGTMKNGDFKHTSGGFNPTPEQIRFLSGKNTPMINNFPHLVPGSVMMLHPYVGMDYRDLQPGPQVRAVLHGLYHSATACVGTDGPLATTSFLSLCTACKEKNIPLFIAPFKEAFLHDEAQYSTTNEMINNGVQMLCDMSMEMTYVKLLAAIALYPENKEEWAKFINKSIFFERLIEY
jgi:L-asparaginase/archaeal Glu-tRNAGln amidotransferase subunit D